MSDPTPDPRFTYFDTTPPAIPPGTLDMIAKKVFDPKPGEELGVWGNLVNGLYLIAGVAYLIAREKLEAAYRAIAKQKIEQGQDAAAQTQVNQATAGLNVTRAGTPKP